MFVGSAVRRTGIALSKNVRMMSASAEEAGKEMVKWKKITAVMVAGTTLIAVYNVIAHGHSHPRHGLPYQKIRNKPYPWGCSDCNLFDQACWDECRKAKSESS